MRKAKRDTPAADRLSDAITARMQSYADAFTRAARRGKERMLAEMFDSAVQSAITTPLTAADLEPIAEGLARYANRFGQLARTEEQQEQLASFRAFIAEVASAKTKAAFQKLLVDSLIKEIKAAMAHGVMCGIPFAGLPHAEKKVLLEVMIDWPDYIQRGLELQGDTGEHIERILENAIAGMPAVQWMTLPEPPGEGCAKRLSRQRQRASTAAKRKQRNIEKRGAA